MPLLLLFVLILLSLQSDWPEPPLGWGAVGSGIAAACLVAGFVGLADLLGRCVRRLVESDPVQRSPLRRRYLKWRRWHFLGLLLCYVILVFFGGWGWTATWLCTNGEKVLPLVEVVMLAPLALAIALTWARFHQADKALHEAGRSEDDAPYPERWVSVWLQARTCLIFLGLPLLLLILQQTVIWIFPALGDDERWLPILGAILLAAAFLGVPWLLRLILGLKPLPDGPIRQRLLATAKRLKFRCTDILVWNTRGVIANAMVTGPLPWLRYVVLTDRLMSDMTPDEVEAVFGHEVGHVRHHHMFLYFFFLLASLVMLVGVWAGLTKLLENSAVTNWLNEAWPGIGAWLQTYDALARLPFLGLIGIYGFVVFGFLSRRCERQADIFGCRTVSCPVFISALERVAVLNGISRDRPGLLSWWLHSTIGRRVAFLERMHADPTVEPRFQRSLVVLKLSLAAGIIAVLCLLGPDQFWSALAGVNNPAKGAVHQEPRP